MPEAIVSPSAPPTAGCANCDSTGSVDCDYEDPFGFKVGKLPCPACNSKWDDLIAIGAAWRKNSSLEKWFPITAVEMKRLEELNDDKFKTIQAYCRAASLDRWKVDRLITAIDQYISEVGYNPSTVLLTEARADAVNSTIRPRNA